METNTETRKLEIEQNTLTHLNTARKWAMFVAIVHFIFLGLAVIIGILAGTFLTAFNTGENSIGIPASLMFIPVLLLGVIFFFPVLFLFRFSKYTSHALHTLDKMELHKAIKNLKAYFAYIGILTILLLTFYLIILILTGSTMSILKGLG